MNRFTVWVIALSVLSGTALLLALALPGGSRKEPIEPASAGVPETDLPSPPPLPPSNDQPCDVGDSEKPREEVRERPSRLKGPRSLTPKEITAVRVLRRFALLQTSFKEKKFRDSDSDGVGEYGLLEDFVLTGMLGSDMKLEADGTLCWGGYVYRAFLPRDGGAGVDDTRIVDPDLAEEWWVIYAWPEKRADDTLDTFSITCSGDVVRAPGSVYSQEQPPQADASMLALTKKPGVITNHTAIGIHGNDGNMWFQCNEGSEPLEFAEDE